VLRFDWVKHCAPRTTRNDSLCMRLAQIPSNENLRNLTRLETELRIEDEIEPAEFDRFFCREDVIESIADLLQQFLRGLLGLLCPRAKNSCELTLIAPNRMLGASQIRCALRSIHAPLDAVIHESTVRKSYANIGALHKPERATLSTNDDEGEVHLVDKPNQQDAVECLAAVIDTAAGGVEDNRNGRIRIFLGERLQDGDFRLAAGHQSGPFENEFAVHELDLGAGREGNV
jgi:hypothetical protein